MSSTKKSTRRRVVVLLIILVCLLIAGSISTIALTHRPRVLWTDLASLVTKPPAASAIAGNFTTLPPGATLPDEQECTARVHRSSWEPRPDNQTANQSVPSEEQLALLTPWDESIGVDPQANKLLVQITGHFTGTTDEILQWAACKWGIDEDIVLAEAVVESSWHQDFRGDYTRDRQYCPPGTWDGKGCYQSYGLLQLKYYYFQSAWPMSRADSAFNVEYVLGVIRTCYEGWTTYLKDRTPLPGYQPYHAGDLWGCLGRWYSGGWYDAGALSYIQKVKDALAQKSWLQAGF